MTVEQHQKATDLLEKITELEDFIKVCETRNGVFVRPFNTGYDCEYSASENVKPTIVGAMRSVLNGWKKEFENI